MDEETRALLMVETINEAKKSVSEDDRVHPKVGAILADSTGNILVRAHRGERGSGDHAEYVLFQKIAEEGIALNDKILFVSLEPCTRRSPRKVACAIRVATSGIKEIHIGTLDPNPNISGRGVNYLQSCGIRVEHFPSKYSDELRELNSRFYLANHSLVVPVGGFPLPTRTEGEGSFVAAQPQTNREGILAFTLEMMAYTDKPVWMYSGDTSWLGDIFVGLLEVSLANRELRVLCQKQPDALTIKTATALGASVGVATADLHVRGTIVGPGSERAAMLLVEKEPHPHPLVFQAPDERTILDRFAATFDASWSGATITAGHRPSIREMTLEEVAAILRAGVPAYREASVELLDIDLRELKFLSANVEWFKLIRVASTTRLRAAHSLPELAHIEGTSWTFIPPIVERTPSGELVIIDGTHRVFYALERGGYDGRVIVVDGVTDRLPAVPIAREDLTVTPERWDRARRYRGYDQNAFRPIRRALEDALGGGSG